MHIDDVESNNKIKLNGGVSVKFNGIGNTFHEEEIKDGRANIELIKNSRFGGFSSRKTVITIEDGNWNHVTTWEVILAKKASGKRWKKILKIWIKLNQGSDRENVKCKYKKLYL